VRCWGEDDGGRPEVGSCLRRSNFFLLFRSTLEPERVTFAFRIADDVRRVGLMVLSGGALMNSFGFLVVVSLMSGSRVVVAPLVEESLALPGGGMLGGIVTIW
jgi:hypothetical protein